MANSNEDRVRPEWACPNLSGAARCGERRIDRLILTEDTEAVHCVTCGADYTLDEAAAEHASAARAADSGKAKSPGPCAKQVPGLF